ncbi:MAG: poly-beta-1,6-N-acetyl-D-glucosamine N-deacetylase PgaB [Paludibacterium sp.]|uniref:poly-beta-1,6-N-acetyl-D-glucosamine N-deacetylase PgaB n=1 Tax=Paludibacterium sp. TaxID=1917523 RepID=UPI0025CC3EAE|nr:poly-beta-1,6-N-acetyl-D-glucosamine N-deacetylase PgaB [Paludibacterium sp.]MBV8046822.1 poly-beta-1,6-N-acetyl-D-glucosamine N-deacetylase PgaB [Paludibacterium sp.]MBV8646859.1 poly-beta-1,6-N-acetyl-D-glucosamine N-deacetylase PgaB [Paludibacterium sp.]
MNILFKTILLCWLLLCGPLASAAGNPNARLIILCYHEVSESDVGLSDPYAVNVKLLAQQLSWMRGQGYHFVSIDQILADRNGGAPLPDKSVLLTFDDGYRSVYTKVFPVLRQFNAPAVIALVGSWLAPRPDQEVKYGDLWVPRNRFVTWAQVREMQASGLVEVANHSYALHTGMTANPQGNAEPALSSRLYTNGQYETPAAYRQRVRDDLQKNSEVIRQETGKTPRVMVWPYGSYTLPATRIAGELGMPVTLSLDAGVNTAQTPLSAMRRELMDARSSLTDLADQFRQFMRYPDGIAPDPSRIMHIDLDYIYDPDPKQTEDNLGRLLDRVKAMGASTVYLQAYADPDGSGEASALYFPNRHMPMRADLFNRVAWQLQTRCNVKVYAWMPLLAFRLPADNPAGSHLVLSDSRDGGPPQVRGYRRLSPYSPQARQVILDLYEDLAQSAHFSGLLFHDDATLSDFEDDSPEALAAYRAAGLGDVLADIRRHPAALARWTSDKIKLLDDFSMLLAQAVNEWQPGVKTARNYYAETILNPNAREWYAQTLDSGLAHYDRVAIMAMPYMENAGDADAWLRQLFQHVAQVPGALDKTVFELQAEDWRTHRPVPTREMIDWVRLLNTLGARHIAYYPDDVYTDHPRLSDFKRVFSMRSLPLQ